MYASVNRVSIGSDNGLSPDRRQAIIRISAEILLIGLLGTNFNDILAKILTFPLKKMRLKVSSAKWWPLCCGTIGIRRTVYAIMMTAAVLAPNRRQAISNHHTDSSATAWYDISHKPIYAIYIHNIQSLNKQCKSETERSTTRWLLHYWWVGLLTQITNTLWVCSLTCCNAEYDQYYQDLESCHRLAVPRRHR